MNVSRAEVQPVVVEPELAEGYEATPRNPVLDQRLEVADDGGAAGGVYGVTVRDGLGRVRAAGWGVLVV